MHSPDSPFHSDELDRDLQGVLGLPDDSDGPDLSEDLGLDTESMQEDLCQTLEAEPKRPRHLFDL